MSHWTRRQLIYSSAATLGSLATGRSLLWADPKGKTGLPKPDKSGTVPFFDSAECPAA
jgi:hypothetical protein